MPGEAAGRRDFVQNLVLGQLADDVAARRSVEFAAAGCGQPFVITVATASPLGETTAAVRAILHHLGTETLKHRLVENVTRPIHRRPAVEETPGPRDILLERLETRRNVAIGREAETVARGAAETVRKGAQPRRFERSRRRRPRGARAAPLRFSPAPGVSGTKNTARLPLP